MKLASIETIREIRPHPNADKLELATVLAWQTVVKKGEFKAGDKCVFIVIDTILPDAEWSAFLKDGDKPIRLNTAKIRGQYSQGLVLPMSVLPGNFEGWQEGADIGGALGVKKYEKEIPACLSGEVAGNFPAYLVSQTDEDNGLSNPEIVDLVLREKVTITMKLDGSSGTIVVEDGEITHVCSRRLSLKETAGNGFWHAARRLSIPKHWTGIIQGELMGPGVQGNQLGLMRPELFIFQIRSVSGWMDYCDMKVECVEMGANAVPLVKMGETTLEALQYLADGITLPNGKPAEGVVIRPSHYPASGVGRPLGFKVINRNYKD